MFPGSMFENHLAVWRHIPPWADTCLLHTCAGRAMPVLWLRSCVRGAALACLARERLEPAPDRAPRCSWQQASAQAAKKPQRSVKSVFWGRSSHLGLQTQLSFPVCCGQGPSRLSELSAVQQCLCQALPPPVLSGLQGKTVLNSSLGSLSLLWEVSLVPGCSECGVEINRVWKTTESFWEGVVHHCLT